MQHEVLLCSIFSKANSICLTADIWSYKNKSFLGVAGHIMDEETLTRKSYVLAFTYFPAPHNYVTIKNAFETIYKKYGIQTKRIVATVTDNGTNFMKAFNVFGSEREDLKKIFDENHDGDDDDDDRDYANLETFLAEEYNDSNDSNSENDDSESEYNADISYVPINENSIAALSSHLICNTHNFHLLSLDGMLAHKQNKYSEMYIKVFRKLNKLWHFSELKGPSQKIIEHLGRNLNKPSKMRWNDIHQKVI